MTPQEHPKQRKELLEWFQQEAKSLAHGYEGAIRFIYDRDFPCRVHFIAHAIRDICDRLVFVLDPQSKPQRVEYDQHMDLIEGSWPISIQNELEMSSEPNQMIPISIQSAKQIDFLVQKHRQRRQTPSNAERLFRFLMRNEPSRADVNWRLVEDFKKIQDWFVERAHLRKDMLQTDEPELQKQFNKFESILHSFVGDFFTTIKILDAILREDKSTEIEKIISLISTPQHEAYFFQKLQNPAWISPLYEHGLFDNPLKIESVGNWGVRYPTWQPSQYLARMATHAPSEVTEIFASLSTNNPSILRNMVDAALKMPSEFSVKLIPAICKASENDLLLLCLDESTELCAKLAVEGKVRDSKKLATSLFKPRFLGEKGNVQREYWYQESLKKIIPILAREERPHGFLYDLCNWLKAFIDVKEHADPESVSDYSWIWRPAIEAHPENQNYDLESILVGFVREAFEIALDSKKILFEEAMKIINSYPYLVFKRTRLHLINKFAEMNSALTQQTIMDKNLFKSSEFKHEYALLIGKRFNLLSPDDQSVWLNWIEKGPEDDELFDFRSDRTEADHQSKLQYWKFKKLHLIRDHLENDLKAFFDEMTKKYGRPVLADNNVQFSSGCLGTESPMTTDNLSKMSFPKALEKVSSWLPEKTVFLGPSIEGLSSVFQEYVATNPSEFSTQAQILIDHPAIYIRKFLEQMTYSIQIGNVIDIASLLKLCQWVVQQVPEKRTTPFDEFAGFVDPDWQWTRDSIAKLLQEICRSTIDSFPKYPLHSLREPLWHLIECLFNQQSKSHLPKNMFQGDPRTHDFINSGINSSKGKALEAALEYGRWVSNHIKISEGIKTPLQDGFKMIPEVKKLLEDELSSENSVPGTLAIIGFHANLIYWIDKNWLRANVELLFPLTSTGESPQDERKWAAWNAFLIWTAPHAEFYKLFKNQYAIAVAHSKETNPSKNNSPNPMDRLGEHLMILYLHGELSTVAPENELLSKFLNASNPDTRRYTFQFVGDILNRNENLLPETIDRFQRLWETYWSGMGKIDSQEKPYAWPFDHWFSSGKLPVEWSIEQFESYLECTQAPEPSSEAVEQLAQIAEIDATRTINILNKIVRSDNEGWRIRDWLESIKSILRISVRAGGNAGEVANQLMNYLGRRGYTDFDLKS